MSMSTSSIYSSVVKQNVDLILMMIVGHYVGEVNLITIRT